MGTAHSNSKLGEESHCRREGGGGSVVGQVVQVQVVGGTGFMAIVKTEGEGEEAGAIVCRGAREEEFLSITVRGGRGFLSGEVASDVTAARSQVAGSIKQGGGAVTLQCRSWLKSHRRG